MTLSDETSTTKDGFAAEVEAAVKEAADKFLAASGYVTQRVREEVGKVVNEGGLAGAVKTAILSDGGKFVETLAVHVKDRIKADRKALLVWVGKKAGVWGPYAAGLLGLVSHFILGLF